MHRADLDRFSCDDLIAGVSTHTGVQQDDLRARTLRRWTIGLYGDDDGRCKLLWLPAAGVHQKSKSFGQQACVACLHDDAVPHLRSVHRLAFVTSCPRHSRLLIDRCPECTAPIQPLYGSPHLGSVCLCWNCGFDLRRAEPLEVHTHRAQEELIRIAQGDWGELGSFGPVYPLAYFRILWIVYRLLATGRFAYPLREWARRNLDAPDVPPSAIPRIKEIERLPAQCRHVLIQYAYALLGDWPSRFVAACEGVGVTSRVLLKTPAQVPFALWAPASSELHDGDYQPAPSEVAAARAFLERQDTLPTRGALNQVLGCKSKHVDELAVPAGDHCAYGTNRYWKLDGVSPDVRAAARAAAVHEGHNVGPWVDQILREALKRRGLI
jgi:hypothetical protein